MTKKTEEEVRWMTVDAARGLGGSVEQLGKAFKRVYGRQHLLRMMIVHILLVWSRTRMKAKLCSLPYRRIYATDLHLECGLSSKLPSPPPSPTLTTKSVKYAWTLLELTGCLRIILARIWKVPWDVRMLEIV